MKRASFMKALVMLGLAAAAAMAMGQPAGMAGPPPGYGGHPGMMDPYGGGGGPGMMGPYGDGPGMMGGYGGWVRHGWGRGNRFHAALSQLDLTADQQEKIAKIHEDTRQTNWDAMGKLLSERFKLRGLYLADKLDANAIVEQQKKIDELRRVMIKAHVEMENQIDGLLTQDQREQLRSVTPRRLH